MDKKVLKAEERKLTGRKVKTLRHQGILPGNIYGKDVKSISVQINSKDFQKVFKEAGETGLVDLTIDSKSRPVLIHGVQLHPKTDEPIHVDFLQVDLKVKVNAQVPVELVGESPAEKQGAGIVVQQINEVEVEALPTDLPEKFEVNIELLSEVDQAIYVKDLKFERSKVVVTNDPESIIAKVEPPQKEEVVEAPQVEPTAEGEAPSTEAPAEAGEEQPKA